MIISSNKYSSVLNNINQNETRIGTAESNLSALNTKVDSLKTTNIALNNVIDESISSSAANQYDVNKENKLAINFPKIPFYAYAEMVGKTFTNGMVFYSSDIKGEFICVSSSSVTIASTADAIAKLNDTNYFQLTILLDSVPTINSKNAVTSNGIANAIATCLIQSKDYTNQQFKDTSALGQARWFYTSTTTLSETKPAASVTIPFALNGTTATSRTFTGTFIKNGFFSPTASYVKTLYLTGLQTNATYTITFDYRIKGTSVWTHTETVISNGASETLVIPIASETTSVSRINWVVGDSYNEIVTIAKAVLPLDHTVNIIQNPTLSQYSDMQRFGGVVYANDVFIEGQNKTLEAYATGNVVTAYNITSTEAEILSFTINGKKCYTKLFNISALPNTSTLTIAHNIVGIGACYKYYGYVQGATPEDMFQLPSTISDVGGTKNVGINITPTTINITTSTDMSNKSAVLIIEYFKV